MEIGIRMRLLSLREENAALRAENARLRLIAEKVSDWQVREYAGARESCLFCGNYDGTHNDGCISLEAREGFAGKEAEA